jgi:hypothetical protein
MPSRLRRVLVLTWFCAWSDDPPPPYPARAGNRSGMKKFPLGAWGVGSSRFFLKTKIRPMAQGGTFSFRFDFLRMRDTEEGGGAWAPSSPKSKARALLIAYIAYPQGANEGAPRTPRTATRPNSE